jgi:hypothetical protein
MLYYAGELQSVLRFQTIWNTPWTWKILQKGHALQVIKIPMYFSTLDTNPLYNLIILWKSKQIEYPIPIVIFAKWTRKALVVDCPFQHIREIIFILYTLVKKHQELEIIYPFNSMEMRLWTSLSDQNGIPPVIKMINIFLSQNLPLLKLIVVTKIDDNRII